MIDLTKYISRTLGAEFNQNIPKLRKRTGKTPIAKRKSDCGISGNTFRAFRGWKKKPSDVYREWVESKMKCITGTYITQRARSRDSFLKWHSLLANSLQKHWKRRQGKNLSVAHCFKCIDLYISWLVEHNFDDDASASLALEKVTNCPLDSQVLTKLNLCYSNALPMGKPSMGYIGNESSYEFCQDLIGVFAEKFGGSRLLFDRFAYRRGNG